MIGIFKQTKKDHWVGAIYWFVLSSLGGLMPIWGGALLLYMFSAEANFVRFIQNGELALYSASIISASLYPLTKNYAQRGLKRMILGADREPSLIKIGFPYDRFFIIISIIILLISSFLFSGPTLAQLSRNSLQLNVRFLTDFSKWLLIFTLVFSYLITVLDEFASDGRSPEEVQNILKKPANKLEMEFEELQKEEKE